MLPSEFAEVQKYLNLKQFLQAQVDMQLIDIRTLLRLPIQEIKLEGGCNLAAAVLIFNLVAGSSVCFYKPSEEALLNRSKDSSARFKNILKEFYPWVGESIEKNKAVDILYKYARNPLVHRFGIDLSPEASVPAVQIVFKKSSLTEKQIYELEDSIERPDWALSTIVSQKTLAYGANEVVISIPGLYWGVHRLLHSLFADSTNVSQANALAKSFSFYWEKSVSDAGKGQDVVSVSKKNGITG